MRLIQIKVLNKICNILRSKPFSPHSILGFGDFHNALPPNSPNDHNDQGSTLFAKVLEPIDEPFPSGQEHTPVAGDNNKVPVLETQKLEVEEKKRPKGLARRLLSINCDDFLPQQRGW